MSIREDIGRPLTAYEELKAWCEKHLSLFDYKAVPESYSYPTTIYFTECGIGFICFDCDGDVCGMGALDDDDMFEHINEVEREEEAPKPDSMLTPLAGQMVRKMIEEYERQASLKENRG